MYTPLHVHSEYSLLNGLSKCDQIAERTEKIGAKACALTDHASASGAVDFSRQMKDSGLKPLLGCELYVCMDDLAANKDQANRIGHQVIIAKNLQGWKDLLWVVSESNLKKNHKIIPRSDMDMIAKAGSQKNLISFSGHAGSILAKAISENDRLTPDWMKNGCYMARQLETMFGKGNFFIEIQMIDAKINKFAGMLANALRQISKATGIPCVATPDAHYCERDDAEDHHVLLCTKEKKSKDHLIRDIKMGRGSKTIDTFFRSNNYHIPSYEDMVQVHTAEELANTNLIADMCEDFSILKPPAPPEFKCPNGMSPAEYLRKLSRDGWAKKMGHITSEHPDFEKYGERVNSELDIFTSIGLSSYFLIVNDILNFVRSKGYIVGPGRGSAAGCMVSNLLGITQVDPIKYNLIFERFYNAGRNSPGKISWPDIDFDIPKIARDDTINYIKDKYGEYNVAQIQTFQKLKGRASLTRVMAARGNIGFAEQKEITKCIPEEHKVTDELKEIEDEHGFSSSILWALEYNSKAVKPWCHLGKDGKLEGPMAKIFEQAIRLENTKIQSGTHAAGIVISNNPISESCPMVLDVKGKAYLAGYDGPSCEDSGLLKLDCLSLSSLDKIMDVVKIVGGDHKC